MPQDRGGRFSTELFERYQRSEQALVATLAEMWDCQDFRVRAAIEELEVPDGTTQGSPHS